MILNDWLRGKIPYFAPPPENTDEENATFKKLAAPKPELISAPEQKIAGIRVREEFQDKDTHTNEDVVLGWDDEELLAEAERQEDAETLEGAQDDGDNAEGESERTEQDAGNDIPSEDGENDGDEFSFDDLVST